MGCGPARISEIVRGKRTITAETSILLGRALGVSPGFFLGLQFDYDLACAALRLNQRGSSSTAQLATV
jgi:addiction module HigA family antidote